MSAVMRGEAKNKKKAHNQNADQFVSWKEKKIFADKEEEVVGKEVEDFLTWTSLIESMDDTQLKEYVMNRSEDLRTVKAAKSAPIKRAPRSTTGKSKCSSSSGLMEAIWKFHREDDEETFVKFKS